MQAKKILVIDKDIITRKFLKHTLEEKGYLVSQAELGKEGLILAWRDQPDVIIVDPLLPDIDGELFIQKIRQDARTASTPVLALSANTAPTFGETCLNQGYTLYFPKSGEAIRKLLTELQHLDTIAAGPQLKKRKGGKLIVFLSGKGGTGVSSLTANIATIIRETEADTKVAVVDMVLPIGSIASLVDYKESINLTTIADLPQEEITPAFIHATLPRIPVWKFSLLAGAPHPEASNLLQVSKIPHIINSLRDEFDYVVIDLGRSLSRISLPIIEQANLLLLVLGTDKESVKLTKIIANYLKNMKIDAKKLYPILNRAIGLEGLTKGQAEEILGFEIKLTIPYMGGSFTIANNQATPVTHKFPNATGTFMLRDLSKAILDAVQKFKN